MGAMHLSNVCSHLQNAVRARLGMTSVPNTKYNLWLVTAMHRQGLISSVTRGGTRPPDPSTLQTAPQEPVTSSNVATRRLWLGLKYWSGQPVLRRVAPISVPTRRITLQLNQLNRVARGIDTNMVKGLRLGECMFLNTDLGVLEIREAIEKRRGGWMLCRVS